MHDNRLPITVFAPAIYLDLQRFMLLLLSLLLLFIFSLVSPACFTFLSLSFKVITMLSFQYAQTHVCPIKPVGLPLRAPFLCMCVCGTRKKGWRQQHKTWSSYVRMSAWLWPDNKRTTTTARTRWQLKAMKSLGYFQCPYCNRGVWRGEVSYIYLLLCLLCRKFSLARFACDEGDGGTKRVGTGTGLLRADIRFNGNCNYSKRNFS